MTLAPRIRQPAVYILASDRNGTLCVGVTSDLVQRIWQHRESTVSGFTKCYQVAQLVWHEMHETMESAILCEKRIKKWRRADKITLIERENVWWRDLWSDIAG